MKHFLLVIVLSAAMPSAADAADNFFITGVGQRKCSDWIADSKNDPRRGQYFDWFTGFWSGYSYAETFFQKAPTPIRAPTQNEFNKGMDAYCAAHPTDLLVLAAIQQMEDLGSRKRPKGKST